MKNEYGIQIGARVSKETFDVLKQLAAVNEVSIGEYIEDIISTAYEKNSYFKDYERDIITNIIQSSSICKEDVIVVSAKSKTFVNDYINNSKWDCVQIAANRVKYLRYLAIYQVSPFSTITYYSEIDKIIPSSKQSRKMIIYCKPCKYLLNITSNLKEVRVQGRHYTSFNKLITAKDMAQVF